MLTCSLTNAPTGSQELDAPPVLGDALLLLRELPEREPEAAEAAVGGIELGARARSPPPTSAGAAAGTTLGTIVRAGMDQNSPS